MHSDLAVFIYPSIFKKFLGKVHVFLSRRILYVYFNCILNKSSRYVILTPIALSSLHPVRHKTRFLPSYELFPNNWWGIKENRTQGPSPLDCTPCLHNSKKPAVKKKLVNGGKILWTLNIVVGTLPFLDAFVVVRAGTGASLGSPFFE